MVALIVLVLGVLGSAAMREHAREALGNAGIETAVEPPAPGDTPRATAVASRLLQLPLAASHGPAEVTRVVGALRSAL